MTRQRTDAGTRRIAAPKNAPAAPARPIQPGTRVCRWPGRDLLTGAHVTPDADVHVVHPARRHIHETRTLGEKSADAVAANVGSWRFVLIQNGLIFLWMLLNITGWIMRWDPWPFLFLNIIMSWQAANTGPILQMSSNRQAAKDRARDDLEAREVETSAAILQRLDALMADLHSHTTCAGHTTIGDASTATRKRSAVKAS